MASEYLGYIIRQNEEDNSVMILKNGRPFIRAVLTRSLSRFQMAGYWPMIRSRAEKVISIISEIEPKDIPASLEDVNWLSGPLTHFEYVGAI